MQENPLDRGGWQVHDPQPEMSSDSPRRPDASVLAYLVKLALLLSIAAAATLLLDALHFAR
jgi:hypothetical protein